MPIYEYRCDNCGHELEAFQQISEAPLRDCPDCNTANLIKKISAAGFRLKGGGWYETDFKSGKKKNVAGADNGTGSGGGGDSSGSSSSSASTDSGSSSGSGKSDAGSSAGASGD